MAKRNTERTDEFSTSEHTELIDIFYNSEVTVKTPKADRTTDEQIDSEQPEKVVEKPATVDPRNTLNDLTGKEWLPETKSFFFQKGLGAKHPHAQIERLHPAPYSFQDIGRLILFFYKDRKFSFRPVRRSWLDCKSMCFERENMYKYRIVTRMA